MDVRKLKDFYFSMNCVLRRAYIVLCLLVLVLAIADISMIILSQFVNVSLDVIFWLAGADILLLMLLMILYVCVLKNAFVYKKSK